MNDTLTLSRPAIDDGIAVSDQNPPDIVATPQTDGTALPNIAAAPPPPTRSRAHWIEPTSPAIETFFLPNGEPLSTLHEWDHRGARSYVLWNALRLANEPAALFMGPLSRPLECVRRECEHVLNKFLDSAEGLREMSPQRGAPLYAHLFHYVNSAEVKDLPEPLWPRHLTECFAATEDHWTLAAYVEEIRPYLLRLSILAPASALALERELGDFFAWARRNRLVYANPLRSFKFAKSAPSFPLLAWEDIARLFVNADRLADPSRTLLQIALLTGEEVDDLRFMRRSDVDWQTGSWLQRRRINRPSLGARVHLSKTAVAVLQAFRSKGGFLFADETDRTRFPWTDYAPSIDLPRSLLQEMSGNDMGWTLRDLRHSVVALSGCAGEDPHEALEKWGAKLAALR